MHAFDGVVSDVIPGAPATASAPDLARLLFAASEGDEQAFGALYDRTSHRVYGMVLRVLRDGAQAAELTQDVYLQVWQRAGQFDPAKARCCRGF
ncbi:sigma factor [Jatrophihabitans lederbergiae]|uniref:Sigma factor n=1 Tax=Jatrophihabitans lederbergiae TaxID=3075547 RepID=A0ABU2JI92_9ACTN|nr:sigma factor [Jatrophihabitans sp. DSM 44399]MDT0264471.1 sigma factor [Jatrophihabitans sp. DSM 44399]